MEHFKWLDKCIAIFDGEVDNQHHRLPDVDWDAEFDQMLEDDEYTAVDLSYLPGDWDEHKHFIRSTLNQDTTDLRDRLLLTEEKANLLVKIQKDFMKSEYYKRDADLMPSLVCSHCAMFFVKQKYCSEHICESKTKCNNCGQNCKTQERLEAHVQSRVCQKKHQCKECPVPFQTNSDALWSKHIKSKEHKESIGIKREAHECSKCKKQFYYEYEYKRHSLTKKCSK
jgi:hypothetical protein